MDELQRPTRLYIAVLVGIAVAALALAGSRTTRVDAEEILLAGALAGAMALAWLFPVPIASRMKFYVDTTLFIAAPLLLQPALALTALGAGTLLAHGLRREDRDWAQALFNAAQVMLVTFVVAIVLGAGGWDPRRGEAPDLDILPYVIVAAAIIYPLGILLVSIVTALETSVPIIERFRTDLAAEPRAELAGHIALVTVGYLAALIASVHPWALVLMGIPMAAVYATLRQQHRVRQESERARMQSDEALVEAQRQARVGNWQWLPLSDRWSWSEEGARLMAFKGDSGVPSTSTFLDAVHPEERGQVAAVLRSARRVPAAFAVGHRVVDAGEDQERVVHHRAEIKSGPEGTLRYLGTVHDVTDRVRAEAALQQAKQTAEEADRAKSRLLSMASHDLRTPLTSIQGYLEVVLDGSLGVVPEEQREFLQVAHRNSLQMAQLVRDLLDLTRIEAGRLSLQRRPVDVATTVDEVMDILEPLAVRRGLQLEADIDPGCPMIDADPDRLHQVLVNVVENALKFTDDDGVRITATERGGLVEIDVTDTGCGIDPADLPYVFDVFQQVGETAKRAGGSGLGLAIVQQLVTLHGGTITVASLLGEGTTMTIRWPVAARSSERHGNTSVDGAVWLPREEKGAAEWIRTNTA